MAFQLEGRPHCAAASKRLHRWQNAQALGWRQLGSRLHPGLCLGVCLASVFSGARSVQGAFCAGVSLAAGPQVARRSKSPSRTPSVALGAEAFDPFGWKGQFKDTVQGLLDGLQDDEQPSQIEEQMIVEIFSKFDEDKDGFLKLEEFNRLQVVTEGEEAIYNQEQLEELLVAVNPEIKEPSRGMPFEDYRRLYVERRLREAYSTDVTRDHVKIFGPGGGVAAAAVAESTNEVPPEGTLVTIEGLSGAADLNGSKGHVVTPVETEAEMVAEGRVIVCLADGERLAVKPVNLKVSR